jgi:hypothetical protein
LFRLLTATLLVIAGPWRTARTDDATNFYTGLKQDRLFSALDLRLARPTGISTFGREPAEMLYVFVQPNSRGLPQLSLAVYATGAEAQRAFQWWAAVHPVSASPPPDDPPGDWFAWWHTGSGGANIVVRRRNIVWHIGPPGPADDALATARAIDRLIRDDRDIAPLGRFAEPPEIVDVGLPQTLNVRRMTPIAPDGKPLLPPTQRAEYSYVRIEPRFRGLGDVNKLRLKLTCDLAYLQGELPVKEHVPGERVYVPDGPDRVRSVHASEVDGRFIIQVRVPDQPETRKMTLIAATEDNVIVTKEVEVRIVPAQ